MVVARSVDDLRRLKAVHLASVGWSRREQDALRAPCAGCLRRGVARRPRRVWPSGLDQCQRQLGGRSPIIDSSPDVATVRRTHGWPVRPPTALVPRSDPDLARPTRIREPEGPRLASRSSSISQPCLQRSVEDRARGILPLWQLRRGATIAWRGAQA